MNLEQIKQYILDHGGEDGTPVFTNYCSAFVGVTEDGRAVYDYNKMVKELMDLDGMSEEDAIEWISYNTVRSLPYAGPLAPIILYPVEEEDL